MFSGKCIFNWKLRYLPRATYDNYTKEWKMFFKWEKLCTRNKNYDYTTTIIANLIFPTNIQTPELKNNNLREESHCQLPSSLIEWSYQKKTINSMYHKGSLTKVSQRCWEHGGVFKIWWGRLESKHGGALVGLKWCS